MPISTTINSAAALYALMTTTDGTDLAQSYIQTENIDMSGYVSQSQSIASGNYDFTGIYDGGGKTITISGGNMVTTFRGLFDSLTSSPISQRCIIRNVNLIYNNLVTLSSLQVWGGLVGEMSVSTVTNCSVRINGVLSLIMNNNGSVGLLCGYMGQESVLSNSNITINNTISIDGGNDNEMGLLCGNSDDSIITDCSILGTSGTYDISLKANSNTNSDLGIICGFCGANFLDLKPQNLINITVNLNNSGSIIIASNSGTGTINNGAICGTINSGTNDITIITNCVVNINNNQTLIGSFNDFFGQQIGNSNINSCQFNYTTQYGNSSKTFTISPAPTTNTPLIYTNSYNSSYILASGGNYYIPNTNATLLMGSQSISLESQTSPVGIKVNGVLQVVGTIFSSSVPNYNYSIIVKGVGSMYFGFNYSYFDNGNIIDTPIECVCEVPICSTNPQTGISADSRVTNIREDKIIKVNVDREFATKSVIYPKFKSYSDYMKYLQAGLKY